ncbi:MAG: methyl-accepting chemotaxis protein [Treponema sp.]|nr:methyl-accepting chemotaxis protein [Treponema sp.]
MKIGGRLVFLVSLFNIIGIGILAGVSLSLAQREISRLADEQAQSIALQSSEKIKNWFGEHISVARTFAQIMEGYKEIPVNERRDYFNLIMRQTTLNNPELLGMYANWAPNALDGMDEVYANTPGADETGRFIPTWRILNGELRVNPIVGFGWDIIDQLPLFQGEYVLDPSVYPGQVGAVLLANMGDPVRDTETGALVGISGAILELSTIQTIVSEIRPLGNGFALVFSSGGIVAAHLDPERLGKQMRESEADTFGPFLDGMLNAVSTGTPLSFSYDSPRTDGAYRYYSVPFTIGHVSQPWTLVIGVSLNQIMAPVYRMLFICLIIVVLSIIIMSVGVIYTARSISKPLAGTMVILKDIAEGDLTREIPAKSKDELGELARYLNFTVENIKKLVLSIRREADDLSQTGHELASHMTETAASINEITATIQGIQSQTGKQGDSVDATGKVMNEMVEHIETLNRQIEKQSACVSKSSSAVEQMLANIQQVTKTLISSEGSIHNLSEAAERGRSSLEEVSGNIQEIAQESAGLLEINGVMKSIASQTNLLSMNAAIEAAHAGEAGKGFAVVAEEIRKLAESSSEQSKTINGVLKKIKESIDKITRSTEGVLLKFEAISGGVQEVMGQESQIRQAMEEQGRGSQYILTSIESLKGISSEVAQRASVMGARSGEVLKESRSLEQITGEIQGGMQEMVSGTEQINRAVHLVQGISGENQHKIEALMREVVRFKVD